MPTWDFLKKFGSKKTKIVSTSWPQLSIKNTSYISPILRLSLWYPRKKERQTLSNDKHSNSSIHSQHTNTFTSKQHSCVQGPLRECLRARRFRASLLLHLHLCAFLLYWARQLCGSRNKTKITIPKERQNLSNNYYSNSSIYSQHTTTSTSKQHSCVQGPLQECLWASRFWASLLLHLRLCTFLM